MKIIGILLFMFLITCVLTGCSSLPAGRKNKDISQGNNDLFIPTPEPRIEADPAEVISGVETDKKVVCLIFEGYSDEKSMSDIAAVLGKRGIPSIFFVSGITANEHSELLKNIAAMGFEIGNYGMSGEKGLEQTQAYKNVEVFGRTQTLIQNACQIWPTYIRCNRTNYTKEVLKAVTAAGLEAAVEPNAFINHHSFKTVSEAKQYAFSVIPGSILTVKLGQELDEAEYGNTIEVKEERRGTDPAPGIRRNWEIEDGRYGNLDEMVSWLADALLDQKYKFVKLNEIESYSVELLKKQNALSKKEESMFDYQNYDVPVTAEPLISGEDRKGTAEDYTRSVFVGDSVMTSIGDYVAWRRKKSPEYLSDAQFLTESGVTIESLLEDEDPIENRIHQMQARSVWLCLGSLAMDGLNWESCMAHYRLLIYRILQKNPGVRINILGMPPKMEGHNGIPNAVRFQYNLKLCEMCRIYGIGFVDTAFPLRNVNGALQETYCLDAVTYGCHLNDAGCEVLFDFISQHMP